MPQDHGASLNSMFPLHPDRPVLKHTIDKKVKKRVVTDRRITIKDLPSDGFAWRKYGSKNLPNDEFPKCYFKCAIPGCEAKRYVTRDKDGRLVDSYTGTHNHNKSVSLRASVSNQVDFLNKVARGIRFILPAHDSYGRDRSGPIQFDGYGECVRLSDEEHLRLSLPSYVDLRLSPRFTDREPTTHETKKSSHLERKFIVDCVCRDGQCLCDVNCDGFFWKKYGQKPSGNEVKSYYKCNIPSCGAKKHVTAEHTEGPDLHYLVKMTVLYESEHNHHPSSSRHSQDYQDKMSDVWKITENGSSMVNILQSLHDGPSAADDYRSEPPYTHGRIGTLEYARNNTGISSSLSGSTSYPSRDISYGLSMKPNSVSLSHGGTPYINMLSMYDHRDSGPQTYPQVYNNQRTDGAAPGSKYPVNSEYPWLSNDTNSANNPIIPNLDPVASSGTTLPRSSHSVLSASQGSHYGLPIGSAQNSAYSYRGSAFLMQQSEQGGYESYTPGQQRPSNGGDFNAYSQQNEFLNQPVAYGNQEEHEYMRMFMNDISSLPEDVTGDQLSNTITGRLFPTSDANY